MKVCIPTAQVIVFIVGCIVPDNCVPAYVANKIIIISIAIADTPNSVYHLVNSFDLKIISIIVHFEKNYINNNCSYSKR